MPIPKSDVELVPYVTNFDTLLDKDTAIYFVTVAQAAAFTALATAYTSAYTALKNERLLGNQSKSLTSAKNSARDAMLPALRGYYAQIQRSPFISDAAKQLIGVHIPKSGKSPQPPISVEPAVEVIGVTNRRITIGIHEPDSTHTKPKGAVQAYVYTYVGTSYPSDPSLWQFQGATGAVKHEITLSNSVPAGAQVWVCAAWVTRAGLVGPPSLPVSVNIQGGAAGPITTGEMKLAA